MFANIDKIDNGVKTGLCLLFELKVGEGSPNRQRQRAKAKGKWGKEEEIEGEREWVVFEAVQVRYRYGTGGVCDAFLGWLIEN
jgi:hypothetical protein